MNLEEILTKLKNYFYKEEFEKINSLEKLIKSKDLILEIQKSDFKTLYEFFDSNTALIKKNNLQLIELKKELVNLKQKNLKPILSAKKSITHAWTNPKGKIVQIPVQDFIQKDLVIFAELARKHKLYLNDGINDPDYDNKVVKAYNLAFNLIKYRLDISNYGKTENWEQVGGILTVGEGDCDDLAMVEDSMLEHIGVPVDCVGVAIGLANNGIGHADLWVKDSTKIKRHCNSSNIIEKFTDLKDFPEFGINDKSFRSNSFNLKEVDYWFNSVFAEKEMNNEEALKRYIIDNSNIKDDATQLNSFTELRNYVIYDNLGTPNPVRECNVLLECEGENSIKTKSNNGGIVYLKIPPRLTKKQVKITYSKEGFKNRIFIDVIFNSGMTKCFQVKMIKGQN